jgi:hypothetical protein
MVGVGNMARLSFDESRVEILSLLEAGKKEFENGNPSVALSILLDAQTVLNEIAQSEFERLAHPASMLGMLLTTSRTANSALLKPGTIAERLH